MNACKFALDVQNACNISGVMNSFGRLVEQVNKDFSESSPHSFTRSEYIAQHPAIILYMDKMCDLMNYSRETEKFGAAFERAMAYTEDATPKMLQAKDGPYYQEQEVA